MLLRVQKFVRIGLIELFLSRVLVYVVTDMRQKPITFRCSAAQLERMDAALSLQAISRTAYITQALEHFLDFAESEPMRHLDLFALIAHLDGRGGPSFAEQA